MNGSTPASGLSPPAARGQAFSGSVPTLHGELTTRSVWWFFVGTFTVTWGLGILEMVFLDQIVAAMGPMGYTNPRRAEWR